MEIRQLRYFIAAAEKMNFTAAANACFITQSTLSTQIKSLEDELGMPLFNRVGKYIENLTEAGYVFFKQAKRILAQTDEARQAINDLNNLSSGDLRIGVTYALSFLLIKILPVFTARYPGLQVYMEYGTSEDLEQKLKSSELDLILTFWGDREDEELHKEFLLSSSLVVAVSNNHPLAGKRRVSLAELMHYDLILPGKGFSTRTFVDSLFAERDLVPNVRMELNDVRTMLALVASGKWATVLTEESLKYEWNNLKGIPITDKGYFKRQAFILWRMEVYQKKAARVLIDLLLEKMNRQ